MEIDFIKRMQRRAGNGAVGPSTARGMGPAGTIESAKEFFYDFELTSMRTRNSNAFKIKLDEATRELKSSLPLGGRHWGSSRKFLNIFLRNCLYNRYLCEHFKLHEIENWMEVPLDSHVGKGLRLELDGAELPRWRTVIGLTPELSNEFQSVAQTVADSKQIARVHLDLIYWRGTHLKREKDR